MKPISSGSLQIIDNVTSNRLTKYFVIKEMRTVSSFSSKRPLLRRQYVPPDIDINYNPFAIPNDDNVFNKRDMRVEEEKKELERIRKKPLRDRIFDVPFGSSRARPRTASSVRGTTICETNGEDFKILPVGPESKLREGCREFIVQEREVFLVNMLMDRTQTEITRMDQYQNFETSMLVDQNQKLLELENQYRMTRSQYEAALFRQRKAMESAIKRRADLSEALRKKKRAVDAMKYQIDVNEEMAEACHRFDRFLSQYDELIPRKKLYENPKYIIDEIIRKENENLLLIEWCSELTNEKDRNVQEFSAQVKHTDEATGKLKDQIDSLKVADLIDPRTGQVTRETEIADRELDRLMRIVSRYYANCFKKSADITALMMLERIEIALEDLYKIADRLDPQYLVEKQMLRDRSRREDQRRVKQELMAKEAQRKIKAALERSQKPVKRRLGRPLVGRSQLCGFEKHADGNDSKGDEAEEALLFGAMEE
jgi:hypothetical protein